MGRGAAKSLSSLSLGPERNVKCYNGYFINGYVFHTEQNRVFLFKCYWYDTTDRGIRVDPHFSLVEINSKARLRNVNDVFVFAKQCQQVYYTYTPSFRKDRSRVDWLSVLKTKPRGRVELVKDENEDISVRDEVLQVSELVEPYRVAHSIDLEENSNFHVFNDSLVHVDAEELNVILSSTRHVDEDDDHIEDCDEGDDYSIDKALCKTLFSCNIDYGWNIL